MQLFASIYFLTFGSIICMTIIKYLNKLHREKKEEMKNVQKDINEALALFTNQMVQEGKGEEKEELLNTLAGLICTTKKESEL